MQGVEDELESLGKALLAAEDWAKSYDKSPVTHAKLIKNDVRLERNLRGFFRGFAKKASSIVNWSQYQQSIKAISVDTVVSDDLIDNANGELVTVVFEEILMMTALGAQAGEDINGIQLGLDTSTAIIQEIARNHVANMVGMKIVDGVMVDNPKAEYSVTQTVLDDIRSSIQTSITLGEDIQHATARMEKVIANPKRAEVIARTETVNSYGQGLKEFGHQSGAVGKEWEDVGAVDECADNAAEGIIPIDDEFSSGDDVPAAHPNCRCSIRLVYQNELDNSTDE